METLQKAAFAPPKRLKMSYEDYLEFAGDSQIIEWVNGEVIQTMPPVNIHQNISRFLSTLLDSFINFFGAGELRYAPFEVKLWPGGPSREPDIFFVTQENLPKLTERRFEGAPDLVIEIISPGSVTEDRVYKFTQYMEAGVREYWIVDPRFRQQQVDFYVLGDDGIFHSAPLAEDGRYFSTVLPHFWLDIDWFWQSPLPSPQLALAQIMLSVPDLADDARAAYQALLKVLQK